MRRTNVFKTDDLLYGITAGSLLSLAFVLFFRYVSTSKTVFLILGILFALIGSVSAILSVSSTHYTGVISGCLVAVALIFLVSAIILRKKEVKAKNFVKNEVYFSLLSSMGLALFTVGILSGFDEKLKFKTPKAIFGFIAGGLMFLGTILSILASVIKEIKSDYASIIFALAWGFIGLASSLIVDEESIKV